MIHLRRKQKQTFYFMKKIKSFSCTFAAIGIISTSCTNVINNTYEDETVNEDKIEISIKSSIAQIKTQTRMSGSEFENNDQIGLYVLKQPNTINEERGIDNHPLTFSQDGFITDEPIYYPDDHTKCNFIAYFPYQVEGCAVGESSMTVSVNSNQSTDKAYGDSDFMIGITEDVYPSRNTVPIDFQHKFSKINLSLSIPAVSDPENVKNKVVVKFDNICTSGIYDFEADEFTDYSSTQGITPHGEWEFNEDRTILEGKKAIIIPQSTSSCRIVLQIDGRTFTNNLPDDFTLNENTSYKLAISYDPVIGIEAIIPSITDWEVDENIYDIDLNEDRKTESISLSTLDFSKTNIYQILNTSNEILGEVCKEYLLSNNVEAQAIVYYPASTPMQGTVLELLSPDTNVHGGSVVWANNALQYTPGESEAYTEIILDATGKLIKAAVSSSPSIKSKAYKLKDTRGSENFEYSVVKIGTQYWMSEDLRTTRLNNGTPMANNSETLTSTESGYYSKNTYYFYNMAAINTQQIAPIGWSIPNAAQWETMIMYLNNESYKLKTPNWKSSDAAKQGNNISMFTSIGTGYFKDNGNASLYGGDNGYCCYWLLNAEKMVTASDKGVSIKYNSDQVGNAGYSNYCAYSIRCIRE